MKLAEKCFEYWTAEDEVFNQLQLILGGDHPDSCTAEGFVWKVTDSSTDYYDGSVEVVRPPDSVPMTRDQADQILELGFDRAFESIGDKGTLWGKTYCGPCNPRKSDRESVRRRGITSRDRRIQNLEDHLKQSSNLLKEVRTGEDFEAECWTQANRNLALLGLEELEND